MLSVHVTLSLHLQLIVVLETVISKLYNVCLEFFSSSCFVIWRQGTELASIHLYKLCVALSAQRVRAMVYCYNRHYTGWPTKNGTVDTVDFQDFALINSYLFSPCWIEHLFPIIITPRSSNLVENFSFHE